MDLQYDDEVSMGVIDDFEPFPGQHCETNATGNLLKHAGLGMSEPMLYGLGEGLAFGVLNFKNMDAPFIGGRPKGEEITQNLATNLGLKVEYRTTRSAKRAWDNVATFIDAGQPVGVKLDSYYLDYFSTKIHFAGHYLAMYGYDDTDVFVADTAQQGGCTKSERSRFEEGRLWKGPMASNALTWTITSTPEHIDWPQVIARAIRQNTQSFLNPPISNFGAKGIRRSAREIVDWPDSVDEAPKALALVGMLMERGGTGGGLFRNMYRDFLLEATGILQDSNIEKAHADFIKIAPMWTKVARLFMKCGSDAERAKRDVLVGLMQQASDVLLQLADLEERTVMRLSETL